MDYTLPNRELYGLPFTSDQFNGMPYRLVGRSGLKASNVGLGTWKMGYPETGDGARVDEKQSMAIFDKAIELGVTFWDTANRYNNSSGNSERIIGKWLKSNSDQRRNVIIATKIFGGMDGHTPNHSRLSRMNILDATYASLKRLQLEYIDLLYFHQFDPLTPVEESLEAIEDLVRRDVVRYLGVSNYTMNQISLYLSAAKNISSRCKVIAVQNWYNILQGEGNNQKGVLENMYKEGVAFIPHSPLAQGLLTDRYLDLSKVGPGDRLFDEGSLNKIKKEDFDKLNKLNKLAIQWEMNLSQMVIAYMLTIPGMGPAIPSSTSIKQLEANAVAGKIKLSDQQKVNIKEILES